MAYRYLWVSAASAAAATVAAAVTAAVDKQKSNNDYPNKAVIVEKIAQAVHM